MSGNEELSFDAEHSAVYDCQNAARYFAMAWAANGNHWAKHGRESFAKAANALGYELRPLAVEEPKQAAEVES